MACAVWSVGFRYYREKQQAIPGTITLDGLVPTTQRVEEFEARPIVKTRRTLAFPSLDGRRGMWVIELIGGGKSSRAVVRKGELRLATRSGVAGQVCTVMDETSWTRALSL